MQTITEASLSRVVQQVDMSKFLRNDDCVEDCVRIADSLRVSGAVLIRDPRVDALDAANFIDMMERYFSQPREIKLRDARPHLFYQVRYSQLQIPTRSTLQSSAFRLFLFFLGRVIRLYIYG